MPAIKKKKIVPQKKYPSPKKEAKEKKFPIVAIGASVGGLEAMSSLLKNLPSNTGMAYIYVQHLNPDHKSILPSLLSRVTKMKVQEIENMEHMAPDNVYVIPYNKIIKVTDGHIKLLPRPKNSSIISIDILFSSLAETHKKNVIGVVLSGNASDGTTGLKAIKDAGGITFAQDDSALAPSMPESAIASGIVDFILSPKEIARKLSHFSKNGLPHPNDKRKTKDLVVDDNNPDLKTIFSLLHKETGVDFSHYKLPTIKRRLHHKMIQADVKTMKEYVKLLSKKNNELGKLYGDFLINVTNFFRDPDAFAYLKTTFLPKLIKSKLPGETLRIWVPACSSGEEAYTLAMLITELQDKKTKRIPVQIFATDLSEKAIKEARSGEYSPNKLKSVSKKYLDRFFTKAGTNYRISSEIRDMCIFAPHNILRDPPFSRMDFISCCNLLIYFDAAAQKKVFATLHFALNDKGHLMLGKAESIGAASPLFTRINNKFKIYSRKKNMGPPKILELTPHFQRTNPVSKKTGLPSKSTGLNPVGIENAIDSALLSHYMPACAVVNKDMEILQFRGPISLFLSHSSGKATLNILKMAKPEFAFELRNALNNVIKTKQSSSKSGIEIEIESVCRMMSLDVSPLKIDWEEPLLLIVFTLQEQVEKFITNSKEGKNNSTQKDRRIKKLTEELSNARAEMISIIESQETTHGELQAANEEIVSTNEEFQTLNEELETSKEEIQASNEELLSTNHELQMRNDLLTESYGYSEAIIATVHEPMIILNKDFHIKSANRSFYKKFHAKKEETEGRFFFELGNRQWNIPKLRELLMNVLAKNSSFDNFEVTHTFPVIGEKIIVLNAHLIVQKMHRDQLILLAVSDITEVRKMALELQKRESAAELSAINKKLALQNRVMEKRAAELVIANKELAFQNEEKEKRAAELIIANYARSLIEASLDPLVTISTDGKITDVNNASIKVTGIPREKLIGTNFSDYFTEPKKAQAGYQQVFEKGLVEDYPLTIKHKNGKLTDVLYNASVYKDDKGKVLGVFAAARDITEQKRITAEFMEAKIFAELATEIAEGAKDKAEKATKTAEDAVKSKQQFLSNMSHEIRTPMNAIIGFTKVVLKTELTLKQTEYLTAIKISGDALIVLINDILDLAKVDAGKMTFEHTPFKMNASISAMLHLFETKIQEKNLELVTEYDENIPEVLVGDPIRLHQVILNLVSNAVKFTTAGKITVKVHLKEQDAEKAIIEFSVTDTGIGIDESQIGHIFDDFHQATSGISRVYGGTGLGLAIVKQLVEPQGGSVKVKSKFGEGSTFSFTLAFQKTSDEAKSDNEILELNTEIKNIKVLVVEDIPLNQLLMKTLLDDFGFERDIVSNGKLAIEILETKSYDVILMDLQMPEMNGFEATEYIRNKMNSNIPIIALTADVTTVDLEKCKAVGMNDYISKPIDEKLLYNKIVGIVKKILP